MSSLYINIDAAKFCQLAKISGNISHRNRRLEVQANVWVAKMMQCGRHASGVIKVDAYELIASTKLPTFSPVTGVPELNWFSNMGWILYYSSLWQRLVVRNNGLMLKKWLEAQIKKNTEFITEQLSHVSDYVQSEVNSSLMLQIETLDRKYPGHSLVPTASHVADEIYRSVYRLHVFMLAKPAINMNNYLKESGNMILDDLRHLLD